MSNLWPLIMLPILIACGDKEEDTAEDTAQNTAEDSAAEQQKPQGGTGLQVPRFTKET